MKMKLSSVHWPSLAIFIAISIAGGYVASELIGIDFWLGVGITAATMLVTGWVATVESEQPGAFTNPEVADKDCDKARR